MKNLHRYISKLLFIGLVTNSCFLYGAWPENVASISDKQKNLYERFCKVFKIIKNRQPDSYFITLTQNIHFLDELNTHDQLNLLEKFISSIEETKSVTVIPDNIVDLLKSQRALIKGRVHRSIIHTLYLFCSIGLFNGFFFETNGESYVKSIYQFFYSDYNSVHKKLLERSFDKYDGIVAMYSQYDPVINASMITLFCCVAILVLIYHLLQTAIEQEDEE